ncbi:uncharacterized protein LOC127793960 [Diospyros lotus]|uniref:uncharacterized protein LOC127793960 n=1 Tax=Diospyros lotus TaxID=55363 RepID=UPI002254F6FF|nr:uncharacterized protein LOC127793960 [Diospyros lotus]
MVGERGKIQILLAPHNPRSLKIGMEGLSAICAGIGTVEEDDNGNRIGYTKGEYCLDNLKDLLRFLRRDDPQSREVFKQVCKWNIVGKDLIPIIEHCQDDRNLVLNAVKVLVFLTMPVEPTSNDIAQQIEYLWALKSSITCSDTVPVIVSLLESPLENLEREAFTEDNWKLVQLVLTLFRNILAVQDIPVHQQAGGSATQFLSLRDQFLELMFRENVMDLILVLTQHIGGSFGYLRQDNLLLLETFHYIFMGQEPEFIAKANYKGLKVDGDAKTSINSLRSIMEQEEEKRKLIRMRNLGFHTQFRGTFTWVTMDGSKTLFKGNPCSASRDALFKCQTVHRGPLKRTVWDYGKLPSTKDNILELLHGFVNQLLSGGYNVLMQSIREDIEKEHHIIQNSDIVIFFQVAQFVTSFQYYKSLFLKPNQEDDPVEASVNHHADNTLFKGNICGPIAASMNESMFLLVVSKWRYAYESLKETSDYKFVSAAESLMKIMIRMLDLVLKVSPEDCKEPQTARILLYKLFYDQTEEGMTQFLLNQIKSFDTHKQAKSDLADLVETVHVVIRLMENLQARGTLRVSRKSRKKRSKKMLHEKADNIDQPDADHASIQKDIGSSGCEQFAHSNMLTSEKLTNQSSDAKREDISIPVQVDNPEAYELETHDHESNLPEMKNRSDQNCNDLSDGIGDSSSDEQLAATDEVDFKVSTLVSALANNSIIQKLCWLLKFYKSNSVSANHYIICMLRRICDDLELSPMLYQLSLLNTFYNILDEQKSSPCKEYENIVSFLTTLVRRMLRKMKSQPLLFVEVLFWKTRKECHYINCESLLHEVGNLKRESKRWESVSKDGEIGSTQGKGWAHRNIADALGDDEADFVLSHEKIDTENPVAEDLSSDGKVSQVQHTKKLRKLGPKVLSIKRMLQAGCSNQSGEEEEALGNENDFPNKSELKESSELRKPLHTRKRVRAFSEDQEIMIKTLFEQFKDHKRCSHMIANALDADGTFTAAQISRKLRQLGLRVPRKRKSEVNMHLRDEDVINSSAEKGEESDDETLLSLIKRSKRKKNGRDIEDATDKSIEGNLSGDNSGGELPGSCLGDGHERGIHVTEFDDASLNHAAHGEAEQPSSVNNVKQEASNDIPPEDLQDQLMYLEDDMSNDATPVASHQVAIPRRKLRVIDFEDDE